MNLWGRHSSSPALDAVRSLVATLVLPYKTRFFIYLFIFIVVQEQLSPFPPQQPAPHPS